MRACCEPVTGQVGDLTGQVVDLKGGVAKIRVGRSRVRFVLPLLKKGVSVWSACVRSALGVVRWSEGVAGVVEHGPRTRRLAKKVC